MDRHTSWFSLMGISPSSSVSSSVSDNAERSFWIYVGMTSKNWLIACEVLSLRSKDVANTFRGVGVCRVIETAVEYCSGLGWETVDRPNIEGVEALATGPTLKLRV